MKPKVQYHCFGFDPQFLGTAVATNLGQITLELSTLLSLSNCSRSPMADFQATLGGIPQGLGFSACFSWHRGTFIFLYLLLRRLIFRGSLSRTRFRTGELAIDHNNQA
jgi:hypothetical protein